MGKYDWRVGKEYREIRYELCDGVAKISINRPERRNAFTPLTVMEMYDAFSEARDDASVGVILLTGVNHGGRHEDEAFCSGGDQKKRGNGGYVGEDNIPRLNVLDLQRLIRVVPKPVIAMVNGYAIGGGPCALYSVRPHHCGRYGEVCQTGPKVGSFVAGYGAGYPGRHRGSEKGSRDLVPLPPVHGRRGVGNGPREQGRALRRFGRRVHGAWAAEMMQFPPRPWRFMKASFNAATDGLAVCSSWPATPHFCTTPPTRPRRAATPSRRSAPPTSPSSRSFRRMLRPPAAAGGGGLPVPCSAYRAQGVPRAVHDRYLRKHRAVAP